MTPTSYTRWGGCVNSNPSKLPNVIQKQRSLSYHRIFCALYRHADEAGRLELRANAIVDETGYSRKTVYKVVNFLQRVNLLFLLEPRTGRGRHSLYRLNWKKPDTSGRLRPASKKCHPPYKSRRSQHRSPEAPAPPQPRWESDPERRCRYLTSGWCRLQKGQYGYKRAAKLFRLSCWDLGLSRSMSETISGLLLQRLEGHSADRIRTVHDRLFSQMFACHAKLHALARRGRRRVCSWVAWLLQRVLASVREEEAATAREEAERARADRALEAELAEVKSAPLDRRRRHCRHALKVYALAWQDLHGRRIPRAELEERCAALAAEFDVPAVEIYVDVDRESLSVAELGQAVGAGGP